MVKQLRLFDEVDGVPLDPKTEKGKEKRKTFARRLPLVTVVLLLALGFCQKYSNNLEKAMREFLKHLPAFILPDIMAGYVLTSSIKEEYKELASQNASFFCLNRPLPKWFKGVSKRCEPSWVKFPKMEAFATNSPSLVNGKDFKVASRLPNNPIPCEPYQDAFFLYNKNHSERKTIASRLEVEGVFSRRIQALLGPKDKQGHLVCQRTGEAFTYNQFAQQMDILDQMLIYRLGYMVESALKIDLQYSFWIKVLNKLSLVYNEDILKFIDEQIFDEPGEKLLGILEDHFEYSRLCSKDFRLVQGESVLTTMWVDDTLLNMCIRTFDC